MSAISNCGGEKKMTPLSFDPHSSYPRMK